MKAIQLRFFICVSLVMSICCSFMACDQNIFTGCSGEYSFQFSNSLSFHILNKKTKVDVLDVFNTPYNYDTVAIFNENWKVDLPFSKSHPNRWISLDGTTDLFFIEDNDKGVISQNISRRFYIYFNHLDIDTLDVDFEMKKDKCNDQVMKYFKVAYNDSVYFDGPTEFVPNASFLKE